MTAHLFLQAMCVVSFTAALNLIVTYPEPKNFSVVKLTCQDDSGIPLNNSESLRFLKNGTQLTSGSESHQVTINMTSTDDITFSFTQEQEGFFSCTRPRANASDEIGLAGKIIYFLGRGEIQKSKDNNETQGML